MSLANEPKITKALVYFHCNGMTAIRRLTEIHGYKKLAPKDIYEGAEFLIGKPALKITILRLSGRINILRIWDQDFKSVQELPIQNLDLCFGSWRRRMERGMKMDMRTPFERRRCKPAGLARPKIQRVCSPHNISQYIYVILISYTMFLIHLIVSVSHPYGGGQGRW